MSGQLDPYWVFGQNISRTKFPAKDAWKLKENEGKQIESEADKDRLQKAEKQHKGQFLIHVPKSSSSSLIVDWDTNYHRRPAFFLSHSQRLEMMKMTLGHG